MIFKKIAILGAGMIGASIMQAAKQRSVAEICVAWSRSAGTRKLAAEADFCDAVYETPQDAVAGADCIIACVPVDKIIPLLSECVPAMEAGALVTDVGSTKATICAEAKTAFPEKICFVGSHPMAGTELNGFSAGNADLLLNRLCFVEDVPAAPRAVELWAKLGMRTRLVAPAEHDAIVAHVSHLPHAVAVSLSATLAEKPLPWRNCGAGGLRDTTRVSAGDPHVWRAILEENRAEIVPALNEFLGKFSTLKAALESGNSEKLLEILSSASTWRLPLSKGGQASLPVPRDGSSNGQAGSPSSVVPIKPFSKKFRYASVTPPGSKSITNRALVLAALRTGATRLSGALFSEDTRTMIACLQELGFPVFADEMAKTIEIKGLGGEIPNNNASLYVENAGTTARFLTAMLALKKGGTFSLDGTEAMRKRPMQGLISALEKLGCEFEFAGTPGHFPFTMKTHGLAGMSVDVDAAASSQILSAILQIAPCATAGTFTVHLRGETVSKPFVTMTTRMIVQFGGAVETCGNTFTLGGGYGAGTLDYAIEPDATAASYFLILPFVHRASEVCVNGLSPEGLQGDAAFAAELSTPPNDLLSVTERGNALYTSAGTRQKGFEINFNAISDTFLTLAAVAPLLDAGTPLTIRGIAHTRKQETDRVAAMATELAKIVGKENVSQTEDSLTILPCGIEKIRSRADESPTGTISISTYNDHRIAMSFGILGTFDLRGNGTPWLEIEDPQCCSKTFPEFFEVLEKIRA